jgi:hypothetical protein
MSANAVELTRKMSGNNFFIMDPNDSVLFLFNDATRSTGRCTAVRGWLCRDNIGIDSTFFHFGVELFRNHE